MQISPVCLNRIRLEIVQEIDEAIRKDHERIRKMIDHKIDILNARAKKEDQSGGNSGLERAIIEALNDIRMKL